MSQSQYQLTIRKGPKVGQIFPLDLATMYIGREPTIEITINDPEISRQHACLTRTDTGYALQDLGSTNGTYVNGERLQTALVELQPRDVISMGSGVTMIYETSSTSGASAAEPIYGAIEEEPAYEADPARREEQWPYSPTPPLVPTVEPDNKRRRNTIIVVTAVLILCCCCSFIAFMYFWGGDWLLQQLGILP